MADNGRQSLEGAIMKLLVFLILISIAAFQLIARGAETNSDYAVESESAQGTDTAPATTDETVLAKDASDILTRMTDFISSAPAFTLVSDTGHEVLQKNGHVLEFGSHLTLAIQRPSKAIGRFDSRNGDSSTTVLDGEAISVLSVTENIYLYDTTRQPGDIDASLDFLAQQLGMPRQLRDFFSKDLTASLGSAVTSGYYVGESMISGVMCDHLALRSEKEDVQVWIAQGDEPVPRRIVITYRELDGQPQFWAHFTEWDFSPEFSDTTFTFLPPEGAKRIHFFVDIPGEESK
jgi:hypothetical protein